MFQTRAERKLERIKALEEQLELFIYVYDCPNISRDDRMGVADGILDLQEKYKSLQGFYYHIKREYRGQ